jgi:outer membrane protein TolC
MMRAPSLRRGIAILLLGSLTAGAPAHPETLTDAWGLALQQDRALAATRSQAQAAGLEAQAARAQRWPTLSVAGSYTQLDDSPAFDFSFTGLPVVPPELFADDSYVSGTAALTVPLFTSGRISSSIAAAEARERGAGAQVVAATSDLKLAVADAYVGVLRARKALAVASSNVRSLEGLAGDTRSMFDREERTARRRGRARGRATERIARAERGRRCAGRVQPPAGRAARSRD